MFNAKTQSSTTTDNLTRHFSFSRGSTILVNTLLAIFCMLWLLPIIGLIVTSFREPTTIQNSGWWTFTSSFTLSNFAQTLSGTNIPGSYLGQLFLNSLTITIPAVTIPFLVALFAAYGFVRMNFTGDRFIYSTVLALMVVPVQAALFSIPRINVGDLNLFGLVVIDSTLLEIWLVHIGFGLPFAIYFLTNHLQKLPMTVFERSTIEGASHLTTLRRIIFPFSLPVLVPFAVFQFMWVWNDLLIALVFLGDKAEYHVLTLGLLNATSRGQDWGALAAITLLSFMLPLAIYFAFYRYIVDE